MAAIVYLDPEDEITSAASRIREAPDRRVALVVPFGSRVATSRINFRLLAREAMVNGKRLDIVAPDASARALAASAGIPVFSSVGEYESALDTPPPAADEPGSDVAAAGAAGIAAAAAAGAALGTAGTAAGTAPAAGAAGPQGPAGDGSADASPTAPLPAGAVAGFAAGARSAAARPDAAQEAELDAVVRRSRELPVARPPRRRPGAGVVAVILVLLVGVAVAAVAAYLFLPTAEITVTPRIQPVGPVALSVRADPNATEVDEAARVIPAQTVELPVQATGEFPATGKRVEKTAATGGVRWTNCDPTASYTIPKGSLVRTADGIAFSTDEQVLLPVAIISGGGTTPTLKCQTSEVSVTAVVPGPTGNVAAGKIRVVPARYNRNVIRVTNPAPTTGGSETTYTRISKKDVDTAMASLEKQLQANFQVEVQDPANVPAGSTAYPETAVLGAATPSVDPATLVNQEVDSFTLALDATGTMITVDPSPVEPMAAASLQAEVTPGWQLVPDSTVVTVGDGKVVDGVVTFAATAVAKEVRPVDAAALEQQVLGRSRSEAQALLAPYGDVVIVLWPDWVDTVPTLDQRVTVTVTDPVETSPSPTGTPQASPSPSGGPSPDASGGDIPSEPLPSG